ncbi:hypothetical protein OTBS_0289 [Orientia tsutsugamushi str. Boryong]|uniref:Uncharacterized protein n=1 Tax=Orientia tsutsugamushi (strain Boryong) TaxID=357244 RepID=A5CCF0_ORITB|nr:hypothetical protein OTBS_0289 [Orientia tsutsugamushi str. Boryong]
MTIQQKGELLSCFDVASYFLVLVDREAGDVITQLKLQRLVYFIQGVHLALFDKPLFKEDIRPLLKLVKVVQNYKCQRSN